MEGLWDPSRKPSDKDFFKTLDYYRAWVYVSSLRQLGLRVLRMLVADVNFDDENPYDTVVIESDDLTIAALKRFKATIKFLAAPCVAQCCWIAYFRRGL